MNINDAFPSKYMKAGDLPEEGSQAFTIEKITLEEIGQDRQTKPVIYFEEFDRALVCNKTNARTIARSLGSEEFDDWIGQTVRLYRTETDFKGDIVEAIRVRGKSDKPAPKPAPAAPKKKTAPVRNEIEVDENGIPF